MMVPDDSLPTKLSSGTELLLSFLPERMLESARGEYLDIAMQPLLRVDVWPVVSGSHGLVATGEAW